MLHYLTAFTVKDIPKLCQLILLIHCGSLNDITKIFPLSFWPPSVSSPSLLFPLLSPTLLFYSKHSKILITRNKAMK